MNYERHYSGHLVVGASLVLIGVLGVLNNLDVIYVGSVWKLWPTIFLFIGLSRLINPDTPVERGGSIWWMSLGLFFLLPLFHSLDLTYYETWPILLVGLGISMTWKSLIRSSHYSTAKEM